MTIAPSHIGSTDRGSGRRHATSRGSTPWPTAFVAGYPRHPRHLRPRQRGRTRSGTGSARGRHAVHPGPERAGPRARRGRLRQGTPAGGATLAVTASIGPGAMNLITGAALATVNRLPVLLLPGDTYATRPRARCCNSCSTRSRPTLTVNDAFRPGRRFFDRITRPEQLLTALPAAMRALVDPSTRAL